MANANQILPFALGVGSNVESAALWLADNARLTGFVAGLASSQKVNTALRQAAFTSAMIAQFTAGYGPGDVLDDGNVNEYENNFVAALGAAIESLIPAGLLYEGDDGGTANAAIVTTTTPTLATWTAGKTILVHKMNAPNSAAMTLTVKGVTRAIKWPDGSDLASGVWPANSEALFFDDGSKFQMLTFTGPNMLTSLVGGEGVQVASGQINLLFHALSENDAIQNADEFAYWSIGDTHHRKTTWANMLAKIIAALPPDVDDGGLVPIPGSTEFIQYVACGTTTPASKGFTLGMTCSGAQLSAGTVPGVTAPYQQPINVIGVPYYAGFGSDSTHAWFYGQGPLTGTWQLVNWRIMPGWDGANYFFDLTWVRIA